MGQGGARFRRVHPLIGAHGMIKGFNPGSIAPPAAKYIHGIEIPPNARLLVVSGQVGVRPDGVVPADIEAQSEAVWNNIKAVLAEVGMDLGDIVKMTSFLTQTENLPKFGAVRDRFLGEHRPTSTLLVIQALARSEMLVEVEVMAAKI